MRYSRISRISRRDGDLPGRDGDFAEPSCVRDRGVSAAAARSWEEEEEEEGDEAVAELSSPPPRPSSAGGRRISLVRRSKVERMASWKPPRGSVLVPFAAAPFASLHEEGEEKAAAEAAAEGVKEDGEEGKAGGEDTEGEGGEGGEAQARVAQPYEVVMVGVMVDVPTAVERGFRRHVLTGRSVPLRPQLRSHRLFATNFDALLGKVDQALLVESRDDRHEPLRLVAQKTAAAERLQIHDADAWARLRRQASSLNENALRPAELFDAGE